MEKVVFSEIIDINEDERTLDVISDGSFKSLLLAQSTLDNLQKHGFKKPSPVQVTSLPPGLLGLDILVQAKSGTGKTLVFAILASENLKLSSKAVQKLVIAPTREIAFQIGETIKKIAPKGTRIAIMTGGASVNEDREKLKNGIHIVVGTTGRLCQLANDNSLNLNSLNLFVLDEADKMMSGEFEKDVNFLYSCVSPIRQVAVFSATYPPHLDSALIPYLRSPIHVRLNSHDVQLIGVKQYVSFCFESNPIEAIVTAFTSVQYKQAFLFCNKSDDCHLVVDVLQKKGIEAAAISAQFEQSHREDVIRRLKANLIKVLVSTDLTARGIDVDNVDLVINMEPPFQVETYLHRIGRAARYGGQGASLTLIPTKKSLSRFAFLVQNGKIRVKIVDLEYISEKLTTDRDFYNGLPFFIADRKNKVLDEEDEDDAVKSDSKEGCGDDYLAADYSILLNKAIHLSSTMTGTPITEAVRLSKENREEKKKFKFVPSRAKKSTKYYMRGEMLSIRDAFAADQWEKIAMTKFDTTKEPFCLSERGGSSTSNEVIQYHNFDKTEGKVLPRPLSIICGGVKEYSRKDLIAISKSRSAKVWREYAEYLWNLREDPFVYDLSMRCTFTQQIRLKRQREKVARDEIMAERNKNRLRLISMGTHVSRMTGWGASFEEYCCNMKVELERSKEVLRRGAIVNKRRETEEYKIKLHDSRAIIESAQRTFEYNLNMALNRINEAYVVPDKQECDKESEEENIWKADGANEEECDCRNNDVADICGYAEDRLKKYDDRSILFLSYNGNIEFVKVFNAYLTSMSTLHF